jgi:hypothetical protein
MKRVNAVKSLMEGARLIESSSDKALQRMFDVAAASHLPDEWRAGVKRLAKQVRRARAYQDRALQALRQGNPRRALDLIRAAEDILKPAPQALVVEIGAPAHGSINLGTWVIRAAKESARRARHMISAGQ